MADLSLLEAQPRKSGVPSWIQPSLNVTPGRDPLGLQTITLDRIMPRLLPGILVLSQRARYFSLHAFLLDEYQRRRLPLNNNDLSSFVKLREFEYAVSVQLCPNGCGDRPVGMVGKTRAAPAVTQHAHGISRQESVESPLGGYGLYYRTPMIDVGMVVPRGSALGETLTPIDVLDPNGVGPALAAAFRGVLAETSYFGDHFVGTAAVPREALEELAEKACLCRLPEFPDEQALLRQALFEAAAPAYAEATAQRCRSFALLLRELEREPRVAASNGAFMQAVWDDFLADPAGAGSLRETVAEWAALAAKDWWQESLSSIWAHFLRVAGFRSDGLSLLELDELLRTELVPSAPLDVLGGHLSLAPDTLTATAATEAAAATAAIALDDLRRWNEETDTAAAGLVLFFALRSRVPETSSPGWLEIGTQSSERQPSFLHFLHLFEGHLEEQPTLAQTIVWLTRRFVINAHEQIAYSKLPEFTFRFRWEDGQLRFYTLGLGRFRLADIRRSAMSQISEDVGLRALGNVRGCTRRPQHLLVPHPALQARRTKPAYRIPRRHEGRRHVRGSLILPAGLWRATGRTAVGSENSDAVAAGFFRCPECGVGVVEQPSPSLFAVAIVPVDAGQLRHPDAQREAARATSIVEFDLQLVEAEANGFGLVCGFLRVVPGPGDQELFSAEAGRGGAFSSFGRATWQSLVRAKTLPWCSSATDEAIPSDASDGRGNSPPAHYTLREWAQRERLRPDPIVTCQEVALPGSDRPEIKDCLLRNPVAARYGASTAAS